MRLLFWMPGLTPNRGLRQPGRDCSRADWGRRNVGEGGERRNFCEGNQTESCFIYLQKAQTRGVGEGLKRKRYILRNGISLTILPFKTKNFRQCPFDFFFKNVTFFWNKRFLSLEKKGNASIFLIEKKALGWQPLVAVLDMRALVSEGSLVPPSSTSFGDDTWGCRGPQ